MKDFNLPNYGARQWQRGPHLDYVCISTHSRTLVAGTSALGHLRKSVSTRGMSAPGGEAAVMRRKADVAIDCRRRVPLGRARAVRL